MKISSKITLISFCTSLFLASSAYASPYINAQVGFFGFEVVNTTPYSSSEEHNLGANLRIGVGKLWSVNDCLQLGLETGANVFGSHGDTLLNGTIDYDRYSFDLLAVADQHITRRFDIFAKAGFAYAKDEYTFRNFLFNHTISNSAIVPKGVLGIGYDVTERINLNLAYNKEFHANNVNDISFLTAGLNIKF